MLNHTRFYNSRPGGVGVMEIVAPAGKQPSPSIPSFVPLKHTELSGVVIGPLASLTVAHIYGFTRGQCDHPVEALYRFPLPGDAAVLGVKVTFGQVEIVASLSERKEAEAQYQRARREGRQAALVTRESPDVFTLAIAGIQPDEDVIVETSYAQIAQAEKSGWSLRIPLTIGPRYSRADESGSPHAQGQPLTLARDPEHRFSLDILMPDATGITSSTHPLNVSDEDGTTRVQLQDREVRPDRDCVLSWQPAQATDATSLRVFTHSDPAGEDTYFLAYVTPPSGSAHGLPREATVLLDHSGSMHGAKENAANWTVGRFLRDLSERDHVNLAVFHSNCRWLSDRPEKATPEFIERARHFITAERDGDGTELGVALERVLNTPLAPGDCARHVLIITDVQVSDFARLTRLAEKAYAVHQRRVSLICIDASPNSFLVQDMARRSGGVARFLSSEPQDGDITTALEEILADWSQPVRKNLRLTVNRPLVASAERLVDGNSVLLGDLPGGRTVWAIGKVASAGEPLRFALRDDHEEIAEVDAEVAPAFVAPALRAAFGAWRILGLEVLANGSFIGQEFMDRLSALGYDPEGELGDAVPVSALYHENTRASGETALRALIVRESLRFGVLSAYTGFVATRQEAGKVVEQTMIVPNALPSGWSEGALGHTLFAGMASSSLVFGRPAMDACLSSFDAMASAPPDSWSTSVQAHYAQRTNSPSLSFKARSLAQRGSPRSSGSQGQKLDTRIAEPRGKYSHEREKHWLLRGVVTLDAKGEATVYDGVVEGRYQRIEIATTSREKLVAKHPNLTVIVYVDDLATPFARFRVADVLDENGIRPLNLVLSAANRLRVVLSGGAPGALQSIEIALRS